MTLLAALAAVVASALAGLVADAVVDKKHQARKYIPMLVVGALVFVGIQAIAQNNDKDDDSNAGSTNPSSGQTSTSSPPSSEDTPQPPQTTPPPIPSPPPTSAPPPTPIIQATSLLKLTAVAEDTNDDIDLKEEGTIDIDGRTYGRALVYRCSLFCNGSSPQTREVTLGRRYQRFVTTLAVLDTSTGRHRVDITLDTRLPKTYTVTPGHARKIILDVTGVSRMRIELYAPSPLKNPIQAGADSTVGRNGGGLPGVGLGDPMLLPRAT